MSTEPKWTKPLVWDFEDGALVTTDDYWCERDFVSGNWEAVIGDGRHSLGRFLTRDEAKAACQAHHERQVRALMTDAAPELYEALAAIVRADDEQELDADFINAGRAALAKARGES